MRRFITLALAFCTFQLFIELPAWASNSAITRETAEAAVEANQFSRAAREYQRLVHESPDDIELRMGLAGAYELTGRPEQAMKEAETALATDGNDVEALLLLGRISGRDGDWGKAKGYFKRALKADENSADAHFGLGTFYQKAGDMEKAEVHFSAYKSLSIR